MKDRVSIELKDGVADVRLTRADKMNALDAAMFEGAFERLQKASHKMAETLYKSAAGTPEGAEGAAPGGAEAPPASGGGAKDDVIDAEYTEGPKNT